MFKRFSSLLRATTTSATQAKLLEISNINQLVVQAQYAVRGAILIQAEKYQRIISEAKEKNIVNPLPFDDIVYCNIGNPHALGQKPITFFRQVMSLVLYPDLLNKPEADLLKLYPADAIERARTIYKEIDGLTGAYTHSQGFETVRRHIAEFIEKRDGFQSNYADIFITDGASPAVQMAIEILLRNKNDGIMVPIPQYPLYSASIALRGGAQVSYYLDEENQWDTKLIELRRSLLEARERGIEVRALCVINPGNPTGQCMSKDTLEQIVQFCYDEGLVLLADEVYQENVYDPQKPFHSLKKVVCEMGPPYSTCVELISFHSISKGFLGECGHRGGYMELVNIDSGVKDQLYKLSSIRLCPNVDGQLFVDLAVKPPNPGDESYELYQSEKNAILESLKRRADKLVATFNSIPGMICNKAEGAMYAFPKIILPAKAIEEANRRNMHPDMFYCLSLLDEAGICVVPGSGVGQLPNSNHFRTTFLPPEDQIDVVIGRIKTFHERFLQRYADNQ